MLIIIEIDAQQAINCSDLGGGGGSKAGHVLVNVMIQIPVITYKTAE